MAENDKPAGEEPRTIFSPGPSAPPGGESWGGGGESWPSEGAPATPQADWGSPAPQQPSWDPPAAEPASDWGAPPAAEPAQPSWEAPAGSAPPSARGMTYAPMAARTDGDRVQIGDVLNHIFEVKRFVARGGMGEVFEGVNVSSDERVAIKVMLPALAADPNVQAMFRKEAKTLTRLTHPALVQYRVLAQEPQLGVLYIVTEYIDGANLSDVLGTLKPSGGELVQLTRRLADGLRVAHDLGAIHRDISPDNVLLEDGEVMKAKVIDFGIAKDLDPSSKTIVGDGFAGKLNYVAPEQLGDFGRDVGPWSDVYSLGLVILAVAMGRNVDMGATLVDAVDKRRAGPDLSPLPPEVRDVVGRMLVANPAERLRSMGDVISALDGVAVAAPSIAKPSKPAKPAVASGAGKSEKSKTPLLVGGGVAAALVLAVGGYFAFSGGEKPAPAPTATASPTAAPVAPSAASGDPVVAARTAIDGALPGIPCSWMDIANLDASGRNVSLGMTGVAQDPGAAQGAISRALGSANVNATSIDFEHVWKADAPTCQVLDTFGPLRNPAGTQLSVAQPKFELTKGADGQLLAQALLTIDPGPANQGFALYGLEPDGKLEHLVQSRAELDAAAKDTSNSFTALGDGRLRVSFDITHTGLSGFLVLSGKETFAQAGIDSTVASRGAGWQSRIADAARAGGWKAEMVWFKTVDDVPG